MHRLLARTMDVLKAFSENDETHHINIQGTVERPLFQANQIARMLGMVNMRKLIQHYSDDLKVVSESNTLGGVQKAGFLTEAGLYLVPFAKNKDTHHRRDEISSLMDLGHQVIQV